MDGHPETIPALFAWRASRAPAGRPWLSFEGESWTLDDVGVEIDRVAVGLAEEGVLPGDRVALLLGNEPATIFGWLAANRLGAIAVPLNPQYKALELAGVLALVTPRVLVTDALRPLAEAACASLPERDRPRVVSPGDLVRGGRGAPEAPVRPEDVAVLLATSGTTGAPKAVMQTHRTYAMTAEAFPSWLGLGEDDRLLVALPLFHVNAQAYGVSSALGCGAALGLVRRFSASRFWEEAKALGATQFNAVGAILRILLRAPPRAAEREHDLRLCYAALALPEEEHVAFERRFGLKMIVGYGLSETTFGTVWPLREPPRYGTIGRLRQHPRLGDVNRGRVVREDGRDAREGETGELWLASPAMMRGYFGDEAATAAAFEDGWFKTGDLVRREADGFYTFVSRKKDVIRRRGENVAAAEIELVLAAHPDVGEAAAVGVPSALGEEEIVAYVTPRPGRTIDPAAVRAFVAERLADFKVPSVIHVRDALPKTATERIAKHLLK